MSTGSWRGQKHQNLLELKLQMVVSCMMCVLGTKWGPLQKQYMILTTKPSLQHPIVSILQAILFLGTVQIWCFKKKIFMPTILIVATIISIW